ncbi:MAG TPA: hypothetical protein DCS55_10790 [Acidimicrobiaceae bacterium]|nr:hypothetical protein [Acidimicrobiaceae bacterium]
MSQAGSGARALYGLRRRTYAHRVLKVVLFLAVLGALAWFGSEELERRSADAPATPSVGYPVVDAGDGVGSVGDGTKGILGGP